VTQKNLSSSKTHILFVYYENILIIFANEINISMPRNRKSRKIVAPPSFREYRPYGTSGRSGGTVELLYEEYEALKLADYDGMHHQEASEVMGISRATFARIYESARKKIAMALVETRTITTHFGNAILDDNWFICTRCNARFSVPEGRDSRHCAMCGSAEISPINKHMKQ